MKQYDEILNMKTHQASWPICLVFNTEWLQLVVGAAYLVRTEQAH